MEMQWNKLKLNWSMHEKPANFIFFLQLNPCMCSWRRERLWSDWQQDFSAAFQKCKSIPLHMGMAAEPLVIDDCGAQLNGGRAALSGLWSCRVWAADEADFLWRSLIELVLKQARVPLSPAKRALYFYSGWAELSSFIFYSVLKV